MTWTLDQLAERAARALVDAEVRVANGRVTGVPDGRLIRWYATIGLVDRPLTGPGRAARYGIRHLLQLVAVKRLQAQGLPLAEIQLQLTGATDTTLRRIAALPPGLEEPTQDLPVPTDREVGLHDLSERGDHGAGTAAPEVLRRPARRAPARKMPGPATPTDGVSSHDAREGVPTTTRFWADRPQRHRPGSPSSELRDARTNRPRAHSPASSAAVADLGAGLDAPGDTVTRVYGVRFDGLLLFLPAEPADDDLDAIAAAALPLLDLLAERGLLHQTAQENPTKGAPS